jgi:uncharacterized protein
MSEVHEYEPGMFCWEELATTDAAAAKEFYCGLFGWSANDTPIGEGAFYTMLRLDGKDVAALYGMSSQEQEHMPPHWNSYVSVASADQAAEKAGALGAKVALPPFDVMEHGRMAVIQDPTGAMVSVWEPRQHIGSRLVGQAGAPCWNELATPDPDRAREFYTGLFGWTAQTQQMEVGPYTVFLRGSQQAAGMYGLTPSMAGMPPSWMPYFAVDDCDASVEKARGLGATIHVGPADIPGIGRFALIQDPQGAMFSIIRLSGA